ncbi:MAG: carboxypeptidase regulatory-like domain-containing protein, partial [Marinirhabdus sp.]
MRTYALFILLLSSVPSISQNCDSTLSGTVTDLHDGSLLVGATLIVAGTEQAVQTDLDGKYTIANLCNGTYSVQV